MLTGDIDVTCIAETGTVLGEGPVWVASQGKLYWVDIPQAHLFSWSHGEGLMKHELQTHVCSIVPRSRGGFIGAGYDGFLTLNPDDRGNWHISRIGDPEPHLPANRFNDGKVDRKGRFWAGTMDRHERATSGSLYRLDSDLTWSRMDTGFRVTNGPAFSLDGRTMYHSDTALQRVYAYDIDPLGQASGRRVFAQFAHDDGYPDGMTVDSENCLWIAFWGGWCLRRIGPDGTILQTVPVPVEKPTSVAFGGDDMATLFVTSANRDIDPSALTAQPQAGGLFALRPGVTGVAELAFSG
jgi:xylono-1,5-lactonase